MEVISSAYGVSLDSRMLDEILYVVDETDVPVCIFMTVCFITLVINRYNDGLHNSGKFLLIPDSFPLLRLYQRISPIPRQL